MKVDELYEGRGKFRERKACLSEIASSYYVEFYDNDVMIAVWGIGNNNISWAESTAENYCSGLLNVKPWSTCSAD